MYRTRPSPADHPEGPVARWDVYELIARVDALIKKIYEIDQLAHSPPLQEELSYAS